MKKIILSLILLLSLLLATPSCGPTRHVHTDNTEAVYGYTRMEYAMDKNLCQYQLDSMITADKMVPLNEWIQSPFGKRTQYLYIKRLGKDELIYTVTTTQCDTIYKCTKKITKEINR